MKNFTFFHRNVFNFAKRSGDIVDQLEQLADAPFDDWFRDSRMKVNGIPLIFHHGTCAKIDVFQPLAHFGSVDASNVGWQRSFQGIFGFTPDCSTTPHLFTHDTIERQPPPGYNYGVCYSAVLRITNPIRLVDPADNHTLTTWAGLLKQGGYLTKKEYKQLTTDDIPDSQRLITLLLKKKYDGIVYTNIIENPGSISVVPFRSDQIRQVFNQGDSRFLRYTHRLTEQLSQAVGLPYNPTPSIF